MENKKVLTENEVEDVNGGTRFDLEKEVYERENPFFQRVSDKPELLETSGKVPLKPTQTSS